VLQAFRTGGGVPFGAYGADVREGIAACNRPQFINLLGSVWLPAIPEVHSRLRADPPARVADVGCGTGWSSLAIAQAYPKAHVDGLDLDEPSIRQARANAEVMGLAGRVTYYQRDVADPWLAGRYDLVTAFECVHDLARPVAALRAMRTLLSPGGSLVIADERTAETFSAPGDDLERLLYGMSILHCLPVGMVEEGSAGTGTAMRPETLRRHAREAGFRDLMILPIEHDFWRFYRLSP
jgi:2-polyprenyl-3-methyl-5-hydroxy-6-metoxy-1,4-benzoquinol methylase